MESTPRKAVIAEVVDETSPAPSVLQISLSFFPLSIALFLCTPRVVINGIVHRRAWGTHRFELPPGQYDISIFFSYLFWNQSGLARTVVEVPPGGFRSLKYEAPIIVMMSGWIRVE